MGYINKSYLQTQFENFSARISAVFAKTTDIPTEMTGATESVAGKSGLVPAPASGENEKYLCGDGTWKKPTASVDTLTTMEQVEASTDDSKAVGAGAVKELSASLLMFMKAMDYDPNRIKYNVDVVIARIEANSTYTFETTIPYSSNDYKITEAKFYNYVPTNYIAYTVLESYSLSGNKLTLTIRNTYGSWIYYETGTTVKITLEPN